MVRVARRRYPTAAQALREAAAVLRWAGSATPRLDAEVLLAHVTGLSRTALLTHPERALTPAETVAYQAAVGRRRARCPVAYVTGRREFMSIEFEVGPGALIPRPETELLVEVAVELAARIAGERPAGETDAGRAPGARMVLADVGTGCGAVAVALARLLPDCLVYATDLSERALEWARRNVVRLGLKDRIFLRHGDLLEALGPSASSPRLDGVVANLPYVPDAEWEKLAPGVRDYEPPESLRGGSDGLDAVRRLVAQLPSYLSPGGFTCLEVGPGQAAAVSDMLAATGLFGTVRTHFDLGGHERVVSGHAARGRQGFGGWRRTR